MIMEKKDTDRKYPSLEEIKALEAKATAARDVMNTWPNYTPFRLCDLTQSLGIKLKKAEIPLFVNLFDWHRTNRPDDYAFHAFSGSGMGSVEYRQDTYVCRKGMIHEVCLKEFRNDILVRSLDFERIGELQVRNYDDLGLVDGTIYPVLWEDYLALMQIFDQWYKEIDCTKQVSPRIKKAVSTGGTVWEFDFQRYKNAYLYDPTYHHAEDILRIIRSIHPDMERIFGKASQPEATIREAEINKGGEK